MPTAQRTLTFLFTDIEGSTQLLQAIGMEYGAVVERHHAILRDAIAAHEGTEVRTEGDSFFVIFESAPRAVEAAVAIQRALAVERWPEGKQVRVRMGVHTGEATKTQNGYVGLAVHHAARVMSAGHGGQVLLTEATRALVVEALPNLRIENLGAHRLKDLSGPQNLHQVRYEDMPPDLPPLRTLPERRHNLPVRTSSLIGREQELADLRDVLKRREARVVTLVGAGGIGKTTLALHAAADVMETFGDGVWFIDLVPLDDARLVVPAIIDAIGGTRAPGADALEALITLCGERELLLVLDNFERLLSATEDIDALLSRCANVTVLATSREPLRIEGEQRIVVEPLSVEADGELPDAAALFYARAAAAGAPVDSKHATAVLKLCARLDGVPLAIELAAAQASVSSPTQLLDRIVRPIELSSGKRSRKPDRHRTIRATIEWSYDTLSTEERRFLRQLSVFRGGFTLDSAEAVCISKLESISAIAALVDRSLLRRVSGSADDRYTMLETIREFAAERLERDRDAGAVKDRHLDWCLRVAEQARTAYRGPEELTWLGVLDDESENLRAALERAIDEKRVDEAVALCLALGRFWELRSRTEEGRRWIDSVGNLGGPASDSLQLDALQAHLAVLDGDVAILPALDRLISRARDEAEWEILIGLLLDAARSKSGIRTKSEIRDQRRAFLEDAYRVASEHGGPAARSDAARELSSEWIDKRTSALQNESIERAIECSDRWGEARARVAKALTQGEFPRKEAKDVLPPALRTFREFGDRRSAAEVLGYLGESARGFIAMRLEQAAPFWEEALELARESGDRRVMARLMGSLAAVAAVQGKYDEAIALSAEAARLARQIGDPRLEMIAIATGIRTQWLSGDRRGAREQLRSHLKARRNARTGFILGMLASTLVLMYAPFLMIAWTLLVALITVAVRSAPLWVWIPTLVVLGPVTIVIATVLALNQQAYRARARARAALTRSSPTAHSSRT